MINLHSFRLVLWTVFIGSTGVADVLADEGNVAPAGQLRPDSVWELSIQLSDAERSAMEPAPPQFGAPGGPTGPPGPATVQPGRETVANLFGMQFPWVRGTLRLTTPRDSNAAVVRQETEPAPAGTNLSSLPIPCRIRYDGDFTYMMSAAGPKRPLYLELLDGQRIDGSEAFRLHTMQLDSTLLRERVAAHVFASLAVPVARAIHAEIEFDVDDNQPDSIGLYTMSETIDVHFLKRHSIPESSLILQISGLSGFQDFGDPWTAYAFHFRPNREMTSEERDRIVEFAKFVGSASDEEFVANIDTFVDSESLLRYLAGQVLTGNVTGFSAIGTNDHVCLDLASGKFFFVASELETALGGAALSGTSDQLANLSLTHPHAGQCKLIDRLMANGKLRARYETILQQATESFFYSDRMAETIGRIQVATESAREREATAAQERSRQMATALGGAGGPGFAPPAGGGPGGFGGAAPPLGLSDFVAKRNESISRQLAGSDSGYSPTPPNFGGPGGGFGGPGAPSGGGQEPISDSQFSQAVEVPDGFTATLFAKPPQVNYPVAISCEPSGVIYVASDEQGSLGTDPDGGKVLRCVDSNGDGVVDEVTTFCRVDHVRGVLYRDGSVWVCHPPYLSVFQDDDGDGVADRHQQLVSGLTSEMVDTRGGDHTTNGIRMGIDGWLYIGDGDYGVPRAEGVDGSTVVLRGGGILRVRPDGTELELFASGLRNPFDIAIDPQLNMFTRDNTNDGGGWDTRVSQLHQSAEYGYPRLFANFSDEIMPPLGVFGNGGGTGSLYLENDRWPEPLDRSLLTSDWGRSGVFHHQLRPDGATFQLAQQDFATVPRATGMDIDAAGHLYVASWWSGEASVYVGPHVGFITRISPPGLRQHDWVPLRDRSLAELIERLRAPVAVVRFHSQGELIRRGQDSATVSALAQVVADRQFPVSGRVAALLAIKQIEGIKSHRLLIACTQDEELREFAIRALADRKSQMDGLTAKLLTPFLRDPSPRVRAQTLIALGRLGDRSAAEMILPLAQQATIDRPDPAQPDSRQVIPHLALRSLVQLGAVDACLRALEGQHWRAALRALRYQYSAAAVEGLIDRLQVERDQERKVAILTTLMRLYQQESPYDGSWWGIRPDTTGPYYDPRPWVQSERIESVLTAAIVEANPPTAAVLRRELQRHQLELPGLSSVSETMDAEAFRPIVIQPVDPSDPNQIGNLEYPEALARTLAAGGDVKRGAALFQSLSCHACHTSAAGQKPMGPHLAEIGKRYQPAELIESILKPSEKIAQGYETQVILLDSGVVISGFVVSESGQRISLRDNQGRSHGIVREEIERRTRNQVSAMPAGIAGSLAPEQLADLIAYLKSL